MSAMNYNDRVVIVTGAGGGLGAAYANFFASRGAKVRNADGERLSGFRTIESR